MTSTSSFDFDEKLSFLWNLTKDFFPKIEKLHLKDDFQNFWSFSSDIYPSVKRTNERSSDLRFSRGTNRMDEWMHCTLRTNFDQEIQLKTSIEMKSQIYRVLFNSKVSISKFWLEFDFSVHQWKDFLSYWYRRCLDIEFQLISMNIWRVIDSTIVLTTQTNKQMIFW